MEACWCHMWAEKTSALGTEAMVGTWKDAAAGSCLASACDDTGNSATLISGSTAYVDMCILG